MRFKLVRYNLVRESVEVEAADWEEALDMLSDATTETVSEVERAGDWTEVSS